MPLAAAVPSPSDAVALSALSSWSWRMTSDAKLSRLYRISKQLVAPLRCRPALDGVGRGLGDGIAAAAVGRAAGTA